MLQIIIPKREYFDDSKQEFIYYPQRTLILEHSLLSISKWESKWKRPFLSKGPNNYEESADYVRCMTVNSVAPDAYFGITKAVFDQISEYINDSMTATWFSEQKNKSAGKNQTVTSELIYYWMIALNIPSEYQKWHLNRLLTLIRICEIKNAPSKKMSKRDLYARNKALNEARRRNLNSNG